LSDFESNIKAKADLIAARMKTHRRRLESGDNTKLIEWIIPGKLGCAQRPLRHHPRYAGGGSGEVLPRELSDLVITWANQIKSEGVSSVITFMHARDLGCYGELELPGGNLNALMKEVGLYVRPLPWEDPAHSKTDKAAKDAKLKEMRSAALRAYDELARPVLLMCSAAIDRSAPAAAFIWYHRMTS